MWVGGGVPLFIHCSIERRADKVLCQWQLQGAATTRSNMIPQIEKYYKYEHSQSIDVKLSRPQDNGREIIVQRARLYTAQMRVLGRLVRTNSSNSDNPFIRFDRMASEF